MRAINATDKERRKRTAEDLAKKIKLEAKFKKELRQLFRKISTSAQILYAASGQTLDVSVYKDDFKSLLKNHYQRVFKQFQNPLMTDLNEVLKAATPTQQDQLDELNDQYAEDHSNQQAVIITNTTQKKLAAAITAAIVAANQNIADQQDSAEVPANINRDRVAADAAVTFNADSDVRTDTIAMTETQNSAETGKKNAVAVAIGVAAFGMATSGTTTKIWNTILDGKQRDAHDEANAQEQPYDQPFLVGGEQLNYPGDTSLGASAGNIINCRCSVQYKIDPSSPISYIGFDDEEKNAHLNLQTKAYTVPQYVRDAAQEGLELHEQGHSGDGLLPKTVREARDLARGQVTLSKLKRMGPWIKRHRIDWEDVKRNRDRSDPEFPGPGAVSGLLWGVQVTKKGSADQVLAWIEKELKKES
jgi:hypothetical protein